VGEVQANNLGGFGGPDDLLPSPASNARRSGKASERSRLSRRSFWRFGAGATAAVLLDRVASAKPAQAAAIGSATSGWQSYTPNLVATGRNPALGSGASQAGRWLLLDSLVIANFAITFGTHGVNPGSGAYRVTLPTPCTALANQKEFIVGQGHIVDSDEGYLGLGPGAFKGVHFHNAPSVTTSVAGIVIGSNLPASPNGFFRPPWTTNHTNATSLDEANTLGSVAVAQGTLAPIKSSALITASTGNPFTASLVGKSIALNHNGAITYNTIGRLVGGNASNTIECATEHTLPSGTAGIKFTVYADAVPTLAHLAGTMANDLGAIFKQNINDNVGDANPWVWSSGDAIIGTLMYEAAS
jgi:hypothetical protein